MTNVPAVQRTFLPVSKVFGPTPAVEDLGEGIRVALAQLSINQNIFSINHRGISKELPPDKLRRIEVVILRSAKTQSKAFWPGKYDGTSRPPTCWSSNSLTPDAQVPVEQKQNPTCATCPNDVFVTGEGGLKSKICGDSKRLAITPVDDLQNELYGGAMVFRVPAGSLGNLDKYGNELKQYGIPYYAYTTWITLTTEPGKRITKLIFEPGRPLNDDEALIVKNMREEERAGRIVNEATIEYEENTSEVPVTTQPPKAAAPLQQSTPRVVQTTGVVQPVQQQKQPAAQPIQTISAAMAKPATPPPSQRPIVVAPAAEQAQVPDEMDEMFGDLIK